MNKINYSIIVPVYNSEQTLVELTDRIRDTLSSLEKTYEIILVDDYSQDDSWNIIGQIQRQYPQSIRAIRLSRNHGQHNAILCGIVASMGEYIITLDDDLQNPPEEIEKLIATQEESQADLVYGIYMQKRHSLWRNIGSTILFTAFRLSIGAKHSISAFRLFKKDLGKKIIDHKSSFIFIDGLMHWYTSQVSHVEVEHNLRKKGKSGYNLIKLIRLSLNLIFSFTVIPLRLIAISGIFFAAVTFIMGVIFIIRKFYYDVPLGFTALIVSISFTGSVMLWGIGMIGEYVSRMFSLQQQKPAFVIKEELHKEEN